MKPVTAINPKVIGELRALQGAGSPVVLAELIDLFLKDASSLLSDMGASLAAHDARTFERAAQQLKGSCGNLGAQAMSRMCADVQAAAHASDWTRASELLPGLEAEFGAVRRELEIEKGR